MRVSAGGHDCADSRQRRGKRPISGAIRTLALAALACSAVAAQQPIAAGGRGLGSMPQPVGPFPPVAAAARLADVVATGAPARRALEHNLMRVEIAERIAKASQACAARNQQNVTVTIVDQFGNIVYSARMDGQHAVNINTALMKAKTALYFRTPTHLNQNNSISDMAAELRAMQLNAYPVSGGLPIIVEDQLLGAIGLGGGRLDEACAWEGLQTVLGPQPPLAPDLPPRPR